MADWEDGDLDTFLGAGGPPVPSWDTLGIGRPVHGVILPQEHPQTRRPVSFIVTQQSDIDGNPLFYDDEKTRARKQVEFHVQTDIRDFSDCSAQYQEKARKNDRKDDGVRRLIVKGRSASGSMRDSAQRVFASSGRAPCIGAKIKMTLTRRDPIPGSNFKENIIDVTFAPRDPASGAIVEEYERRKFKPAGDDPFQQSGPAQDPWAGNTEAPF